MSGPLVDELLPILRRPLKDVYNGTIRPYLPRKYGIYAGVAVRRPRLFDIEDRNPTFKRGMITAIHEHVDDGDRVTLVGGGRGVTTVHCLRAGAIEVVVYEPAAEMLEMARETVDVAGYTEAVDFRRCLVGEAIDVFGSLDGATYVHPASLATNDVLVMDCEGAEHSILEGLTEYPETIVVETHPAHGAANQRTWSLLEEAGYTVRAREYEPEDSEKLVLVGTDRAETQRKARSDDSAAVSPNGHDSGE